MFNFQEVVITHFFFLLFLNSFLFEYLEQHQLEELMKSLTLQELTEPHTPHVEELVIAKFTEDDSWYRAKVLQKSSHEGEFDVFYVDYGNVKLKRKQNMFN